MTSALETINRIEREAPRRSVLPLVLLCALSGCAIFSDTTDAEYQTITADPAHDTELAIEEHEKALAIISRHLDDRTHHSDLAKAKEHLQLALAADVTYGPAHNTLGMLYYRQRKLYLAAWEYEYAIRVMPDRAEPLYNLGMVYESAKKPAQAIAYYEMALQTEPQNPIVLGNLARARIRSGESIDMVRPQLEQLLLLETRPGWITWADRKLSLNPLKLAGSEEEEKSDGSVAKEGVPPVPPAPGKFEEEPTEEESNAEPAPGIIRIQPEADAERASQSDEDSAPRAEPDFLPPLVPPGDDETADEN